MYEEGKIGHNGNYIFSIFMLHMVNGSRKYAKMNVTRLRAIKLEGREGGGGEENRASKDYNQQFIMNMEICNFVSILVCDNIGARLEVIADREYMLWGHV
jgi:hypothetical protein